VPLQDLVARILDELLVLDPVPSAALDLDLLERVLEPVAGRSSAVPGLGSRDRAEPFASAGKAQRGSDLATVDADVPPLRVAVGAGDLDEVPLAGLDDRARMPDPAPAAPDLVVELHRPVRLGEEADAQDAELARDACASDPDPAADVAALDLRGDRRRDHGAHSRGGLRRHDTRVGVPGVAARVRESGGGAKACSGQRSDERSCPASGRQRNLRVGGGGGSKPARPIIVRPWRPPDPSNLLLSGSARISPLRGTWRGVLRSFARA
jgi:hypothetical protein